MLLNTACNAIIANTRTIKNSIERIKPMILVTSPPVAAPIGFIFLCFSRVKDAKI